MPSEERAEPVEPEGPAWAQNFAFGEDEMEVTCVYRPESFEDAVQFMSQITGFGGEIVYVQR